MNREGATENNMLQLKSQTVEASTATVVVVVVVMMLSAEKKKSWIMGLL